MNSEFILVSVYSDIIYTRLIYTVGTAFLQGDIDGNGNIDSIEFVNLMTDIYKLETPELLEKAFQYLDKNSDQ